MQLQVRNQNIRLNKSDFIAQGGEGSVYVKNNLAYKIYHNPNNIVPLAKIDELSKIQDNNVIKPLDIIYSKKRPIGYSMRYVEDTHPLCKLFTKAFKNRNKLSYTQVFDLVQSMRQSVQNVHDAKILIVDVNELNFLVSNDCIFYRCR